MLVDLILELQKELNERRDGYVQRAEEALGQIVALHDSNSIGQLLLLLDDDAEHDELMFSIIHSIEVFDGATYVRELIDHLESLLAKSPRWATIIHIRILNSPPTLAAYAECIKRLSSEKMGDVQKVLKAVTKRNAAFASRCEALLAMM